MTQGNGARPRRAGRLAIWALLWTSGCGAESVPPAEHESATDPAVGAEPAADNSKERFSRPPLPDSELLGSDEDGDHIRDDVARYIDETFDGEWQRLAVRQHARSTTHLVVSGGDRDKAFAAATEIGDAVACLAAANGSDLDALLRDLMELREVTARILDTEERLLAYLDANDLLNGGVFTSPLERRDGCRFDLEGLAP